MRRRAFWPPCGAASARLGAVADTRELLYAIEFMQNADRLEITDEILQDAGREEPLGNDAKYYYRLQEGRPIISVRQQSIERSAPGAYTPRNLPPPPSHLSAWSQIKDTVSFPEFSAVAERFGNIQIPLRTPQPVPRILALSTSHLATSLPPQHSNI